MRRQCLRLYRSSELTRDASAAALPLNRRRRKRALVPAEDESLEREDKSLEAQNESMHERESVSCVENETFDGAGLFRGDQFVVAGIGVGDAAAARGNAFQPSLIKGLEKYEERPRPRYLLRVNQLLSTAKLTGSNEVLHIGHDHGDVRPRLGYTKYLGRHSDLHHLRLDLAEASLKAALTGAFWNQNSR